MKEILNITHVKLDLNPLLPPGQNVSKQEKLQVIFCPMSSELLHEFKEFKGAFMSCVFA